MKLYHLALILFMCPLFAEAQKIDETKYLAGAVPQNELGIVVFSQTYEVPGKQNLKYTKHSRLILRTKYSKVQMPSYNVVL